MRYLLIGLLPPDLGGPDVGGVASITPNWAKHLAAMEGNEVFLWAPAIKKIPPDIIPNVTILPWLYRDRNPISLINRYGLFNLGRSFVGEVLSLRERSKGSLRFPRLLYSRLYYEIKKAVEYVKPDVVNDHVFYSDAFICHAAVHNVDPYIPITISVHGVHLNARSLDELPPDFKEAYLAQARYILSKSDYIFFSSTYNLEYSKIHGLLDGFSHYTVVTDGIDVSLFDGLAQDQSRHKLGLDPMYRYILFVGNLLPRKGCHLLLNAFSQVANKVTDIKLIIIGDGPERGNLYKQANELKLSERIKFIGTVLDPRQLYLWYKSSDLYVLPSQAEGLSISILEAMTAGLPVVSCRPPMGSYENLRDGETCLLTDYGDVDQLASAIEKLLTDKQLSKRLSENAARLMRDEFDWKVRARIMNQLTQAIVEQKKQIRRLEANH
jgi:glycosyltransferase involved in cell wall biosynthesis